MARCRQRGERRALTGCFTLLPTLPRMLARPTDGVTNWMHMFRWIVKTIRDDYGIDESRLTRGAMLETDLGLSIEQVEETMEIIAASFAVRFPPDTLGEVLRLEELCMVASWMKGLYKRPPFISDAFEAASRQMNPAAGA
jgi:hypothetical protein